MATAIPIELLVMGGALLFIVIGSVIKGLRIFKILGSILLIILAVVLIRDPITSEILNLGLASVCFGVGFIVFITDSFSKGKQKERFDWNEKDDKDDGRFHDND